MNELQFYFDHFQLTVYPESFLIEVARVENPPRQDNIKDFPGWAFRSKNAIWFCQENEPYRLRASHGDQIKQKLLTMLTQT